jgi:DNA anti-recombination protein RmuC
MSDEDESIDNILNQISQESNQVAEQKDKNLDATDKKELAKSLVNMTNEDREMADKIFKMFYPNISMGTDRSQASKEAITRALELKINAGRNIIELMKLLKQEEKSGNIGIFINEKKAGIDINNINNELED